MVKKKKKFYKKKKPQVKKDQLPSNSRTITERLFNDHTVFFLGISLIIGAIFIVGYDFYGKFTIQEQIRDERREVVEELNYWNQQIIEKPGFRDGYFKLALIYYQLGDYHNAEENLDKVMGLDPNFEEGIMLGNILEEK